MKKISVKLALFFIVLIFISSLLSLGISLLYVDPLKEEIQQAQTDLAESILRFTQTTGLPLEQVLEFLPLSMYGIEIIEQRQDLALSEPKTSRLEEEGYVFLPHRNLHHNITVLDVDGTLLKIYLLPHKTLWELVGSQAAFSLIAMVIIGTILVLLLTRNVVKPVVKLSRATQKIARGNFDVHLEHKSRDEIGQLTRHFNQMADELKKTELMRKDFITHVSHEFKTPIASMQGFARLLSDEHLSQEERKEYADILIRETNRLSRLSDNILRLSRLETQEELKKQKPFYLDEQIRNCLLALEPLWTKKDMDLDIHLEKILYQGDEELLEQVWLNLLSNAIKFTPEKGLIKVEMKPTDKGIQVDISDTGIGMDESVQQRIFDQFYQGDQARRQEGAGLGLTLAKRIVELFGGEILVDSGPDEGSTFTVILPFDDREEEKIV